jgi:hypothetical protein
MACEICRAPKDIHACELCATRVCKNCVAYLSPDRIRLHPAPPATLKQIYCVECFESEAAPFLAQYDEAATRAVDVTMVSKNFRGPVDAVKRAAAPTKVDGHVDCRDAEEQLRFLAAWNGFDAILQVETGANQLRNHGYQSRRWWASGLFAKLAPAKASEESK